MLTRLGGAVFALNPDLIERADATPDTVLTLVDGTKYIVCESIPELIDLVRRYRASVIDQARHLERGMIEPVAPGGGPTTGGSGTPTDPDRGRGGPRDSGESPARTTGEVVPLHRREG